MTDTLPTSNSDIDELEAEADNAIKKSRNLVIKLDEIRITLRTEQSQREKELSDRCDRWRVACAKQKRESEKLKEENMLLKCENENLKKQKQEIK